MIGKSGGGGSHETCCNDRKPKRERERDGRKSEKGYPPIFLENPPQNIC